jgi:hypothetical protein
MTANALYGENYVTARMGHRTESMGSGSDEIQRVSYMWRMRGRDHRIEVVVRGESRGIREGSPEEFITEHYWGYSRRRDGATLEYRVEHPRWRTWQAEDARLDCDVARMYGDRFVECLSGSPASAFLADGSDVRVFSGVRVAF